MQKIKILPNMIKKSNRNKGLKRKKDKAYIIGGGPSINIASLSKLTDGDIIVVNKAIEYFKKVDFFITIDYSFLVNKTDFNQLKQKADTTIFVVNRANKYIVKKPDGFFYDTRFKLKYEYLKDIDHKLESRAIVNSQSGFALDFSQFANGENSGFCAIQLALLMGYKEIYLLGFDLKTKGVVSHFHGGYKNNNHFRKNLLKYQKTFDKAFSILPPRLKEKIISCSDTSYLNKYIKQINFDLKIKDNPTMDIFDKVEKKPINKKNYLQFNEKEQTVIETNCINKKFKDLLVVGYFTLNTPYELEKEKLLKSIKRFGLQSYLKGIANQGDWQKNTRYKAVFLKEMLEKFPNKKILYVDADAEFLKEPTLFENYNCDIAIRWQDFRWRKNESLSGTIYLESNAKTISLCKRWIQYNNDEYVNGVTPKTMEQHNLGKLIEEMRTTHKLIDKLLPASYCSFDHVRKIYPDLIGKEVIVHYQASRRFRSKVAIKK